MLGAGSRATTTYEATRTIHLLNPSSPLSPLSFTTSLQLQHAAETGNSLSSEEVTMIQTQLVVLAALGAKGDGVTALVGEIKNASKRNRAAKLGMNWVRSEG